MGTAHLTNGAVLVKGEPAVDVDLAVGFIGNDKRVLPRGIEYVTRADFRPLSGIPALVQAGLPPRGTFTARLNGDLLGQAPLEFWSRLEGVPAVDGKRILPAVETTAHGHMSPEQTVSADVAVRVATTPRPTDAAFDVTLNLRQANLEVASGLRSRFFDAAEVLALVDAFTPKAAAASPPVATARSTTAQAAPRVYAQLGQPLWSALRGHFDLELGTVRYSPYQIDGIRGRLELSDRALSLSHLTGEMFAGRWSGNVQIAYRPENKTADHALKGEFTIEQFDSARIVQTVFPTELASVAARIDLHSTVQSEGNALFELMDRAAGSFTAEGRQGVVRLAVPKQEMAATAAVFGGTILLSPELRALGRLLKKFAEMPVDQLRVEGARSAGGDITLNELRLDSPQARLLAHGRIPVVAGEPLMNRPLELAIDLAAKDEMAVILGGMNLLEKKPRADGYRALKDKFVVGGKAGEPDTRPLYDLLAKAVMGSKGTWGFLMRKVQDQVNKKKPTATTAAPSP
jgi:hypothetical protein